MVGIQNVYSKIVKGHEQRKSRFHDAKGNFMGWSRLAKHFPLAIGTGILRYVFGHRPSLPWISYEGISILKSYLNNQSCVFEYGSGMSTAWYAQHAGSVVSVEDQQSWYKKVSSQLEDLHLSNVKYLFAESPKSYSNSIEKEGCKFDLVIVDGSHRDTCMEKALEYVKPGGIIYLDNSDAYVYFGNEHVLEAEKKALEYAKENDAEVKYITDFSPGEFFVHEALMIFLPTL